MQLILNGETRPIPFFLASSADHVTGLTGAAPAVTLAKNGGAFAAPSGTVAEMADGWYSLEPAGADVTTNGVLLLHATAAGADPADVKCQVVAFSPYDPAALGLADLAAAPTLSQSPTLAEIKAGILDDPLSAHTIAGTPGAALGALVGALAESYAANGQPATLAQLLYGILAILGNVSQTGTTLTAARLDGETQAMAFTLDSATAPTTRRRTA
jgi:hypothetical protein